MWISYQDVYSQDLLSDQLSNFLSVILLYLWSKNRINRRGICLVGLCESGKTLIFNQLVFGKAVETYTSIKENIGSIEMTNKVSQLYSHFIIS